MIPQLLILAFVTFLPFFELSASIPLGMLSGTVNLPFGLTLTGFGLPIWYVFVVCVFVNMLVGPIVYLLLYYLVDKLIHYPWFAKPYNFFVRRTQKKIEKVVDKWGELGIIVFLAIPGPGSGGYTAALGAYILGLNFRKFVIANCIGMFLAGIVVTIITWALMNGYKFLA